MDTNCTIYKTANFIGKKWTIIILLELYKGKTKQKRYNELKKKLPSITSKILSMRLKELEDEGLIKKEIDYISKPVKTKYNLTKVGLEFIPIILDIKKWALKNKFKNKLCTGTDCEYCSY